MNNTKVSIIIPAYNADRYIDRCVRSALSQTLREVEIIIVDDGSTDKTKLLCSGYRDDRIRVISQENAGPAAARNKGLECATGEYIGFIDSDDYVSPEMFESLYTIAIREDADVVNCSHATVNEKDLLAQNTWGGILNTKQLSIQTLLFTT